MFSEMSFFIKKLFRGPPKLATPSVQSLDLSPDGGRTEPTQRHGILGGPNANVVLPDAATQLSNEIADDELDNSNPTQLVTHFTRASRNGRSAANYDMKLHPMDNIMRPTYAARRQGWSRPEPASGKPETTSTSCDESVRSAGTEIGASNENDNSDEYGSQATMSTQRQRKRDPNATRNSIRIAAQRFVSYSSRHHPQDSSLPGYWRKARLLEYEPNVAHAASSQTPCNRQIGANAVKVAVGEDSGAESFSGKRQPQRARKKLKTLCSSFPMRNKFERKRATAKKRKQHLRTLHPTDSSSSEVSEPNFGNNILCRWRGLSAEETGVRVDNSSAIDRHATKTTSRRKRERVPHTMEDFLEICEAYGNGSGESDQVTHDFERWETSPCVPYEDFSEADDSVFARSATPVLGLDERMPSKSGFMWQEPKLSDPTSTPYAVPDVVRFGEGANHMLAAESILGAPETANFQTPSNDREYNLVVVKPHFNGYAPQQLNLRKLGNTPLFRSRSRLTREVDLVAAEGSPQSSDVLSAAMEMLVNESETPDMLSESFATTARGSDSIFELF